MKTLHLTNAWHETSGGIATLYRALMQAAERRGQEIRLIVPGEEDRVERAGEHAVIYHLKAQRAPFNSNYRILWPTSYLYPGSAIQRILKEEQPDLIEVCDKYNLHYLAALSRLKLMQEIEQRPTTVGFSCERMDDNFATYMGRSRAGLAFSRWYMKWVYFAFFDHHIVISQHTAEELRAVSEGHPVERGVWLRHPGVDLATFGCTQSRAEARAKLMRRLGRDESCRLLVYAGRLAPEKNLPLLLQTMRLLKESDPDALLLIAGDGIERAAMERSARELKVETEFLGHIGNRSELAEILSGCEVFLHPNPKEPFGIAPLEAMASGLVLVAPNRGGVTEYADDKNAMLVEPTPSAFAGAVQRLLRESELLAAKSGAAQETASTFSKERTADAFLDLYDKIDAATRGKLPLSEAGCAFRSTVPAAAGKRITGAIAEVFKSGFRAWVRLRTRTAAQGSVS
jgi:alpha-1,6-mannosyltransferase